MDPMDPSHLNPHFNALDIILGYLNRGNSAPEIRYISSVATAWCQQYHHSLLDYTPASLDEVLCTHPFLFDLSIRSFARLFSFNDLARNDFASRGFARDDNLRQQHSTRLTSSLSHIRPFITAQQFFVTMIDAYTLHVGGNGRWFHDRVVAQDLKTSPIIHYIPEVIHRIAALNVRELLTSEFSTFSPKTSLGFSYHLAKGMDIVMMDAPPVNASESDSLVELMDVDGGSDVTQEAPIPRHAFANNNNTRASAQSSRRKSSPKGTKRNRHSHPGRRQPWSGKKKRKKRH